MATALNRNHWVDNLWTVLLGASWLVLAALSWCLHGPFAAQLAFTGMLVWGLTARDRDAWKELAYRAVRPLGH